MSKMNEQVRQALEAIWQAERVCHERALAHEALKAESEAHCDRLRQANDAWQLARQERDQADAELRYLVRQAEKEEAA